jgi:hypothetical protein
MRVTPAAKFGTLFKKFVMQIFHLRDRWVDLLSEHDQEWLAKEILNDKLNLKRSRSMWVHPDVPKPYPPGVPHAAPYFRPRVFLWFPLKMWGKNFRCPKGHAMGAGGFNKSLREVRCNVLHALLNSRFINFHLFKGIGRGYLLSDGHGDLDMQKRFLQYLCGRVDAIHPGSTFPI